MKGIKAEEVYSLARDLHFSIQSAFESQTNSIKDYLTSTLINAPTKDSTSNIIPNLHIGTSITIHSFYQSTPDSDGLDISDYHQNYIDSDYSESETTENSSTATTPLKSLDLTLKLKKKKSMLNSNSVTSFQSSNSSLNDQPENTFNSLDTKNQKDAKSLEPKLYFDKLNDTKNSSKPSKSSQNTQKSKWRNPKDLMNLNSATSVSKHTWLIKSFVLEPPDKKNKKFTKGDLYKNRWGVGQDKKQKIIVFFANVGNHFICSDLGQFAMVSPISDSECICGKFNEIRGDIARTH